MALGNRALLIIVAWWALWTGRADVPRAALPAASPSSIDPEPIGA